ncbi:FAD-dependent oxidoreductase [Achromobacter aloeverae]|uniref:FAD-dependent monooxygenase n=1 Tax=Achromobacter aloeverae TaxID=1750518 RepID=A0A4Q1HJJ3_9BURK|nr:FAD-dependent monooxygenase [Achromobacter aloeverae]RXN90073.1 FAD-dependent monooxygenase [Achromobacter aloeverae]
MKHHPLRIGIAGAGLGGLCLAQGLARVGMDVDVFERDAGMHARAQGYRLRIDADGQRALAACLAPDRYALFRHSATQAQGAPRWIGPDLAPREERRPVNWRATGGAGDDADTEPGDLAVHRQTLREILGDGLQDRIRYGHAVVAVDVSGAQAASAGTLVTDDGQRHAYDLIVAADGVASPLRQTLLPHAAANHLGAYTVYGRTPLDPACAAALDARLLEGVTVVFGAGLSLIIEPMRFSAPLPALAARHAPGCTLSPADDYLYWAFLGRAETLGVAALEDDADAAAWLAGLRHTVRDWHSSLRRVLDLADPRSISQRAVRMPDTVPEWPVGAVTFLGDAIHAMSPAGGLGANTALADAASLAAALATVRERADLRGALRAYESDLRARGRAALQTSLAGTRRLLA